jgi:hypothetical protein
MFWGGTLAVEACAIYLVKVLDRRIDPAAQVAKQANQRARDSTARLCANTGKESAPI